MRIVVDTNVLLAGLATQGVCHELVSIVFQEHSVILSEHILSEVAANYVSKFRASETVANDAVQGLRTLAEIVEPVYVAANVFEDAGDLPVLGTALAGKAECIVTGDAQLLALRSFEGVAILSPRELYDRLRD